MDEIECIGRWIEYRARLNDGKRQMKPFNRKLFKQWAAKERKIIMAGDNRDDFKKLVDLCSGLNVNRVIHSIG